MTLEQRADVDEGLKQAADIPVKEIDLEAVGTWNKLDGPAVKLEAGIHPWKHFTAYAAGTWSQKQGPGAELGGKWTWDWP